MTDAESVLVLFLYPDQIWERMNEQDFEGKEITYMSVSRVSSLSEQNGAYRVVDKGGNESYFDRVI